MRVIILAAGYATRLYPLTEHCAKPLLSINGRPIIEAILDGAFSLGNIQSVHVVTNAKFAAQFEAWASKARFPVPIVILNDGTTCENDRLGAIGDIQFALEAIGYDDDLFIAAGDNYFTFPLYGLYDDFMRTGGDMICVRELNDIETLRRFAVATLDADNRVVGLVEKPRNPPSGIGVYALYLYRRDTLPLFSVYLSGGNPKDAPGHFPAWLYTRKPVYAHFLPGECVDIGTKEAYYALKKT